MGIETRQLSLDLAPAASSHAREAFLIAGCNRPAVERVEAWTTWPDRKLVLSGEAAGGKTHLAHIWAAHARGVLIPATELAGIDVAAVSGRNVAVDDADQVGGDRAAEEALLHLHNALQARGRTLLMTARTEPGRWPLTLPDLASRIAATGHVRLGPADDALLEAVLVKLFHDRQVHVGPRLIAFLVRRMDRSLASARDMVDRLDSAALAAGRPISREMAAAILDIGPDPAPSSASRGRTSGAHG